MFSDLKFFFANGWTLTYSARQRPNAVDNLLFPRDEDHAGLARVVQRDDG
jgi:hypothetical protein